VQLSDIRLYDPVVFQERLPYEWFDHLRAHAPVHRFDDPIQGVPFWAVTKHADVVEVSRHPRPSRPSSGRRCSARPCSTTSSPSSSS
jgi:cytochrome P450